MTGTVLDGNIDVALLKTDGEQIESFGRYTLAPYSNNTVELLREAVDQASRWQFHGAEPDIFAEASRQLTIEQSDAVKRLVEDADLSLDDIGVVGFHGQTVLHRPPQGGSVGQTRQLGDGALMSQRLNVPVVDDFRSADMQLGGQGAPLSAIYHKALLSRLAVPGNPGNLGLTGEIGVAGATGVTDVAGSPGMTEPSGSMAVLNLGGVANLTWWDGRERLIAFDTGPANAPINDFVREVAGLDYDKDGALAAAGVVDEKRLAELLNHAYFNEPFPKSLDRFGFSWQMAEGLSLQDGAALLTAFCAAAVGKALAQLPHHPKQLIVCGGGRHNASLMKALEQRTGVQVVAAEQAGWRGDAVEAECFAYLAVRTLRGLANSYPGTTGVTYPVSGGVIHRPSLNNNHGVVS